MIEKFGLHPPPERFDHGVVIAIADRAKTQLKTIIAHVASGRLTRKLSGFNRSMQHLLIEVGAVSGY